MDKVLELLRELMPAWAALATLAIGYLVYLFKKASDKFISLADKQAEYLRDRFEVVDKSTTIFSRTIEQQEKEIDKLTKQIGRLSNELEDTRRVSTERAIDELNLLAGTIHKVAQGQELLFELINRGQLSSEATSQITEVRAEIAENLEEEVPRAIRLRDRSIYPIKTANLEDAQALIGEFEQRGFTAEIYRVYEEADEMGDEEKDTPENSKAIWLGSNVPSVIAVEAIEIAVRHWPFLRYVHLSADSSGPDYINSEIFFGGATQTAEGMYHLRPWTESDFEGLRQDMSLAELHKYVRERYGNDNVKLKAARRPSTTIHDN